MPGKCSIQRICLNVFSQVELVEFDGHSPRSGASRVCSSKDIYVLPTADVTKDRVRDINVAVQVTSKEQGVDVVETL